MILIRWAAFILAAECLALLAIVPRSTASAILAVLFFIFFLTLCGTFRTRKASS